MLSLARILFENTCINQEIPSYGIVILNFKGNLIVIHNITLFVVCFKIVCNLVSNVVCRIDDER